MNQPLGKKIDPAVTFANAFDRKFRALTSGLSCKEVPLFQAMHKALVNSGGTHVEEYHGNSYQVRFSGNGSYARTSARCELSDLMIIAYSSTTKSVRLTYLQAKSERATLPSVCGHQFSANLEQWFLLNRRPKITGLGRFNPPPDLLSNALLPSVGSFAFFYKDMMGDFQIYYASASYLTPPSNYSQRYGKLQSNGPCFVNTMAGYAECVAACGNQSFAGSLYRLEIGTPIDGTLSQALKTRDWLASNLKLKIREAQQSDVPSELASELLDILASEESINVSGSFGARYLIIIKSADSLTVREESRE